MIFAASQSHDAVLFLSDFKSEISMKELTIMA